MPIIQRMSEDVFSRIAAGEVVERPASILKELIENSLDAGALRIDIEAEEAGKKNLRVSDDGSGMDAEDCRLCLERHATSKICALEDLESLSTFGFRGEALAAVAAVSRISVASALKGAQEGWTVEAEAGRIVKSSPAPAIRGTAISVRDLFFNTPARLKFLKSEEFERGRLLSVIEEAALANPETAFFFKSEGKNRLSLEALGKKESAGTERIVSVLGESLAQNLLVAEREMAGLRSSLAERERAGASFGKALCSGLRLKIVMSAPGALLTNRRFQYWFVNRRPIEARILQQALYRAYTPLRLQGRHPLVIGYLELDPATFDVNVHPAKREIRFRNEREIFDLVLRSVSEALAKAHSPGPLLRTDSTEYQVENNFLSEPAFVADAPSAYAAPEARTALFSFSSSVASSLHKTDGHPNWFTPPYRYLGQIERSYLIFEAAGGLFVLDQHAASECVLFERYGESLLSGSILSERLLLPISVSLPASAVSRVLDQKDRLLELGFEVEALGKGAVQVLSTPPLLHKEKDVQDAVQKLAEDFGEARLALNEVRRKTLSTIACKAAVKAHDPLGEKEALALLDDLSHAREPQSCPHGRPTMIALSRGELARRFGRPGAPPLKGE